MKYRPRLLLIISCICAKFKTNPHGEYLQDSNIHKSSRQYQQRCHGSQCQHLKSAEEFSHFLTALLCFTVPSLKWQKYKNKDNNLHGLQVSGLLCWFHCFGTDRKLTWTLYQ